LIPPYDVPAAALEAKNEAGAKAQAFQESGRSDHILDDEPGITASLGTELLQAPETTVVGRVDLTPQETI